MKNNRNIHDSLQVINILNLIWDDEGKVCLKKFAAIRDVLAAAHSIEIKPEFELAEYDKKKEACLSQDVVIFEVKIMTLVIDVAMMPSF